MVIIPEILIGNVSVASKLNMMGTARNVTATAMGVRLEPKTLVRRHHPERRSLL
jgi:hypothetical protein